jgi:serine phosphatase RsbU (regulator of sigma subunit)
MPSEPGAAPQRRPAGSADPHPAWPAPYPRPWPEGGPVPAGDEELTSLLQFFYHCPVGLFEVDDAGRVNMVNPAAVALLAPVIADGDLSTFFPLLARLAPQLFADITTDRGRLGPLTAGQRMLVPVGGSQQACVEMQAVRVAPNRVMIVVQDVPAGQQLALRERDIATELRLAMLGRADEVPGLAVGVTYRAADGDLGAGGDWYDVIALPGNRAGLVVGDTVGHNLAATSAMGQLRSALRATARYRPEPAELLGLADTIALGIDGAPAATLAYGLLDLASGELSYASAGHPPILVIRSDGSARYLTGGRGLPLGIVAADTPRTADTCSLAAGDIAVMFTDGLYQQRDEPRDTLLATLQRQAVRFRHLPPAEMSRELTEAMLAGRAASGDTCVLVTAR